MQYIPSRSYFDTLAELEMELPLIRQGDLKTKGKIKTVDVVITTEINCIISNGK